MMMNTPLRTPAPPQPATALPKMKTIEDLAKAQMRDPAPKTMKAPMKVTLRWHISKNSLLGSAYLLLSCGTDRFCQKVAVARN